ncbi:hypothetical protein [Nostoc sp. NZL]|uniref:hypothetical protein n=1 Tax=Nostoc sp. NZL TaxID=2650612 RepID=UPI0018C5038E|nr:hypothetical protein [Nostoc sp. NZL]
MWNVEFLALDSSRRQIRDYGRSLLSDLGKVSDRIKTSSIPEGNISAAIASG